MNLGDQPTEQGVPEIYRLIENGASVTDLSRQLYLDYFSGDRNPEKAFLAIKELMERGHEGRAALMQMAAGSDELSRKIAEIRQDPAISDAEIEKMLGIRRFGPIFNIDNQDKYWTGLYKYAVSKGIFSGSPASFFEIVKKDIETSHMVTPAVHVTEKLDDMMFSASKTFQSDEPGYLELLGPKELLRLRKQTGQKMLLLGSYGKYSAREFRRFADKITKDADTYVIDNDPLCIKQMRDDKGVNNNVVEGDIRKMSFDDGTMDQVFTNHLFHFIGYKQTYEEQAEQVRQVMSEAARVLKSGGSFIINEQFFGEHADVKDVHRMLYQVKLLARGFGLKLVEGSTKNFVYSLRREVGSATIDENGFPHYEKSALEFDPRDTIRARFIKE